MADDLKVSVTRYHDICAGHRVYGHENKCKYLHGHNYRVHFTLMSNELDSVGRVIDFGTIRGILCDWLEEHWDHKTLLHTVDPLSKLLPPEHTYLLPCNPTAENLSVYLLTAVAPMLLVNLPCKVVGVKIEETPKCSAEAHYE